MPFEFGEVSDPQQYTITIPGGQSEVIDYRMITHPDGDIRIEYFHSHSVKRPDAYAKFMMRMSMLQGEYGTWKTVVGDSLTLIELAARKQEEMVLNPNAKDPRRWFAGSTSALETMFIDRWAGLPMNVVLTAHVDKEAVLIDNEQVRNANARGRLGNQGLINAAYQEQYFTHTVKDANGARIHQLMTVNDGYHQVSSQIDAPNPCYPHYESIWANWDATGKKRMNPHCLVYGDTGTGKSTFAATWPKPMLVLFFDPMGKDIPYWKHWV